MRIPEANDFWTTPPGFTGEAANALPRANNAASPHMAGVSAERPDILDHITLDADSRQQYLALLRCAVQQAGGKRQDGATTVFA